MIIWFIGRLFFDLSAGKFVWVLYFFNQKDSSCDCDNFSPEGVRESWLEKVWYLWIKKNDALWAPMKVGLYFIVNPNNGSKGHWNITRLLWNFLKLKNWFSGLYLIYVSKVWLLETVKSLEQAHLMHTIRGVTFKPLLNIVLHCRPGKNRHCRTLKI